MKIRVEDKYDTEKEIKAYSTELPDEVAHFAMQLITQHANIAGHEDGEDSQGRAKLRLQKAEELVTRSFDIAQLTFETARSRGLMVSLPDLNEINADYDASRAAKRTEKKNRDEAVAASKVA